MKHHDDRAGAEEEQRFEERVGEKVKHRRLARGETDRHHHVTELRERGIGENAFDVVLLRRDQRGHDRGDGADPCDDQKRGLATLE